MPGRWTVRVLLVATIVASLALHPSGSRGAAKYTVTDVGTLVGTGKGQFDALVSTNPLAFNEKGEVAGVAMSAAPPIWAVAFTSNNGKITRVGKESQFSFVFDLNDAGDLVGYVKAKDDPTNNHLTPVVWRAGKQVKLPTLGGDTGIAYAFGPDGEIVGVSSVDKGEGAASHATVWRNDKPIDLGTLGGKNSLAYSVNSKGEIVGNCETSETSGAQPCVWRDDKPEHLQLPDGMSTGFVSNINDDEVMSGTVFDAANAYHAARWVDGRAELLPGLFDGAIGGGGDISESGVIVGSTQSAPGAQSLIGAIWVDGKLTLLQDLIASDTYTIGPAAGINEAGQIVASATTADGTRHGVVLSPVDQSAGRVSGGTETWGTAADFTARRWLDSPARINMTPNGPETLGRWLAE